MTKQNNMMVKQTRACKTQQVHAVAAIARQNRAAGM
jgi:hypothetical protein